MMLYKSSPLGFRSARVLLALSLGAAFSTACVGEDATSGPTPLPQPVSASRPPPPISGGTLLVTSDDKTAVAADPDRDRVIVADINTKSVSAEILFNEGDEPGRVIEGAPGRVYVALRRAGAIATIDLAQKKVVKTTPVCVAPRGMAFVDGLLHVACAEGELVTLDTATNKITRMTIGDDLRDIVVQGSDLLVTQFRSAKILRIDESGKITETQGLTPGGPFGFTMQAAVAWRMVRTPNGEVGIVHQSATTDVVVPHEGGYGQQGPCGEGIVGSFVSMGNGAPGAGMQTGGAILQAALPVDLAFSRDGQKLAVVSAGNRSVMDMDANQYRSTSSEFGGCMPTPTVAFEHGQPIAVAFADSTRIVQTRQPARLVIGDTEIIELGGEAMYDTGHAIFHESANTSLGLACASCHPEGHEDGHVWQFADVGVRRTQSIAGGILATAPFHWAGDLDGIDTLMSDVFTGRMAGPELDPARKRAAALWIDSIPATFTPPAVDLAAIERGKELYNDATVACNSCHSGGRLTNNQSVDVGTFGVMQVPSLRGIAARAPYMHDGCAATLEERFTNPSCGGGDNHGKTSHLSTAQIGDLVAYLKTL
jgi:DNA-binding beta-propeller fold protein YncE/mono/diheme cytochrome c family protein